MTAPELLAHLRALNVHLSVEGGRLRVNAPKGAITAELTAAMTAQKDALVKLLAPAETTSPRQFLAAVPRGGALPLSFMQERLWMLARLQPEATAYNIATLFSAGESADVQLLEWAIRRTIQRHEILRARFVFEGDGPVVRLAPADATPIVVTDLRALPAERRRQILETAPADATHVPFDLANEAPVRFHIFRTSGTALSLLIAAHHIALDAWSFVQIAGEISAEYINVRDDRPAAPPPALQYADFAHWQRQMSEQPEGLRSLAYWRKQLNGLPQVSVFPADHTRGEDDTARSATHDFVWPVELYEAARSLARECGATLYMVLLAGMAALLYRHTGQTDIAIGSPIGTRDHTDIEGMIGPILNPIVLRLDVDDGPTFAELIARVRETLLEGHAHQQVPFERVVRELNPPRSLRYSPLFQIAVVLHNTPAASEVSLVGGGALYDLSVFATESGTLTGSFEYRADVYDAPTIARLSQQLQTLLTAAARDNTITTYDLPLIDESERDLVLQGFNQTERETDPTTLVDQFRRAAVIHAEQIAVVASDRSLTYRELDRASDAIASRLRAGGVTSGSFVALVADRTAAVVAAALGILKSGGAYLPIDLTYPPERVAFMLRDSGTQHVVTTRALEASPATAAATAVVLVDDAWDAAVEDAGPAPQPSDTAYIIYTSGSTGTPKGVLVPHSAVSNFLAAMQATIGFDADDAIVSVTSPSFDISVLELFLPLVRGGRVIIAERDAVADGSRLSALIASSQATMLQSTPSGWRLLMNAGWAGNPRLRAIVGGEALAPSLAEWLRPRVAALWNAYGPTETTVWSTLARIDDDSAISIGRPIANTRVYLLDGARRPVPIATPGEIYIAGDGVALGYHQRPELTHERFVPEPGRPGSLMYRTGDMGRWRSDGQLDYLGREDGQVKVRGYRIETGEIEALLCRHDAIAMAIVGIRALAADDPRIVAWVQFHDGDDSTASELRRFLRKQLPDFMIPSIIAPVETWPLTPNGKIDRRALPDVFASGTDVRRDSTPPSTPTERIIADIWRRLLNVHQLSVTDSFFELGGHSLLAMRAAHEIAEETGRTIDSRLLFFRTLGQLAETCDALPAALSIRRA